ncbi:MAG: hypothetical protein ACEY3D_00860 [Rickettsia sp.]
MVKPRGDNLARDDT